MHIFGFEGVRPFAICPRNKATCEDMPTGCTAVPKLIVKRSRMYVSPRAIASSSSRSHVDCDVRTRGCEVRGESRLTAPPMPSTLLQPVKANAWLTAGICRIVHDNRRVHDAGASTVSYPSNGYPSRGRLDWSGQVDCIKVAVVVAHEDPIRHIIDNRIGQNFAGTRSPYRNGPICVGYNRVGVPPPKPGEIL